MLKSIAPSFQGLWKWAARIFTERVGHAFQEPVWLEEPGVEVAQPFVLQVMDQFVAHKVRMPAALRHNQPVGSYVVGPLTAEAICLGALVCGTKDGAGNLLNAADVLIDEGHGFYFQFSRFGEAGHIVDTNTLGTAVQAEQFRCEDADGLERGPRCQWDEVNDERGDEEMSRAHREVV